MGECGSPNCAPRVESWRRSTTTSGLSTGGPVINSRSISQIHRPRPQDASQMLQPVDEIDDDAPPRTPRVRNIVYLAYPSQRGRRGFRMFFFLGKLGERAGGRAACYGYDAHRQVPA